MAQPPAYNREKDFAKDFGNETDHTALNAELDKASNSINDIRANLALIQADDGKIRASSITSDSLAQEVLDYVQAKALAGANAVADAATDIAQSASEKADNAVQVANSANAVASDADSKADEAIRTANAASTKADTAISTANTANTTALEAIENADSAITTANNSDSKADQAVQTANAASTTASNADTKSDSAIETSNSAKEMAQAASDNATTAINTANTADSKADQALAETAQIDTKVDAAVDAALHDAVIPGLTPETIEGALGYIPYNGETNAKAFATRDEVAEAIDAIPNADWNASAGAAAIRNKPVLSAVATSGNYADLNGKPTLSAVATSGRYSDLAGTPDIIATACPVGMIYIQYAGQAAPADLFGGTWDNISDTYAGLFFRAEGGAAAAFGETQGGGAPNIQGTVGTGATFSEASGAFTATNYTTGFTGGYTFASGNVTASFSAANSNAIYGAADEIRPANSTIRIWKRTA